jgi:hypothetical protein
MDADRRITSIDHLEEIGIKKPNGDVISHKKRHLAAKFTFSQITRKPPWIHEKYQWTTYRESVSMNRKVT